MSVRFFCLFKGRRIHLRHDIDEILLGFTTEQYEKYLSILNEAKYGKVSLDFDVSETLPCTPSHDKIVGLIKAIEDVAKELLSYYDPKASFFSSTLTKDEIDSLASLYYKTVIKINALSTEMSALSLDLVKNLRASEIQYRKKVKIYQDFLPYLVSLYEAPDYKEKIAELDAFLYKNVENSLSIMKRSVNMTQTLEKICESIIPNLLAKSGKALGLPPYDDFSSADFYSSIVAFIEQLKNEKRAFFE